MNVVIVEGDLLDQKTDVIVNPWNRNIIPWWLLIPHGVSGAIKKRAGLKPFKELGRLGPLRLGDAVVTSAGDLPFKSIIHVASIDPFWRASEKSIHDSVVKAIGLADLLSCRSIAFPILGAGSGGFDADAALEIMVRTFDQISLTMDVTIVRFKSD